ncbi:Uncharacterized protein ALO52_05149 [Pseudomonas syringae pv. primulae]|uniref:Uncharacterized protein n=1 Tax=Pseudomonas syringae pv. primulae TaxID=251707 RepID=A0A0P9Y692_9PSED|nr:Uncharacterized protein ALO52_05149 [Pseudomonas syringae pv. primulae]
MDTTQVRDQVRDHAAFDHRRDLLQVREAWGADPGTVAHGAAVARQVITVDTLGRFDHLEGFVGRHDRAPRNLQEVRDQGFDVLQGALFGRRRGQRVIRLVRAGRHVAHALVDDLDALAHFFHAHHATVVGITMDCQRDFELEVLVARIRTSLAQVEVQAGGTQAWAGNAPVQRFFGVVGSDANGTALEDAVLQCRLGVFVEALWQPVHEVLDQLFPAAWQVVCNTADAIPGRVQTETGNGFDHRVCLLTVGEGEEHRGHRAHVLDIGTQEQQVAGDTEELGHHDTNHVDAIRHGDAGQFLDRKHVRQVVHHPAEVIDAVGVRDVAVPGLAFAHLLGTTVVIADVRDAVDDFFAVQLQDDTERTVGRRVVRAQVEEHVVLVLAGTLHAPGFRIEARCFFFQLLFGQRQAVGIEFGRTRGEVLAQRMAFPGRRHHDAGQVRVAREIDPEHVPHFTLVPVGVWPDTGDGRHAQVAFRQRYLEHDVAVTFYRHQVIEHSEVGARQSAAVSAQALVHAMQVVEHGIGLGHLTQERQDFHQSGALDPQHRHAGASRLGREGLGAKTVVQFNDDVLVVSLVRRDVQSVVCSHRSQSLRSTYRINPGSCLFYKKNGLDQTSSGLRRLVT